jgi:diaminopimelate epimerase
MNFAKAHAYGNDFLYVLEADVRGTVLDTLAREMCDRHTGVGADGLIVYEQTASRVAMRLINADGSRAEISGNGLRALAALVLHEHGPLRASVTIATEGGIKQLVRSARNGCRQTFRTAMGQPAAIRQEVLEAAGESLTVVTLEIGNPHCVLIGRAPDDSRFRRLGDPTSSSSMSSARISCSYGSGNVASDPRSRPEPARAPRSSPRRSSAGPPAMPTSRRPAARNASSGTTRVSF